MKGKNPKLLVILGPTASGKSALSLKLAQELGSEILSADSLQVYKKFDIGTAKPSLRERELIPHHMIDIVEPEEDFNAGTFRGLAASAIEETDKENKSLILAGGTYLYVKILLSGLIDGIPKDPEIRAEIKEQRKSIGTPGLYERLQSIDPEAALKIHSNDYVRIERALEVYYLTEQKISELQDRHNFRQRAYDYLKIGISFSREELRDRIDRRVDDMLDRGLVEEVSTLRESYGSDIKPMQSIGYKQINKYLEEELSFDEAVELIKRDTKRFAKRQMTWLRADEEINWYSIPEDLDKLIEVSKSHFSL